MKLYSTLSGTTETFSPSDDVVKMYVCGVTPYAPPHVGHAMNAVVFDVMRRYLEFRGYVVKHVENFTDIDDKMIQGAAKLGISTRELAERNIQVHLEQMEALNVLRPHIHPRATQEIPKIQEIVKALVQRGLAYEVNGDVYFRVRRNDDYGKLGHRNLDSMRAGARVEIDESKEDPMDFVLWKSQKPGEPSWDSPWGPGRPGWHIECSAMSLNYLGATLDIHGGGQDLVFPHHENEIAQTESYTNSRPMARFWVHNGLLRLGDDKMSKSLGNFVTVGDALKRFSSDALRLFFLSSHYRSPLTYSERGVAAQERAAERLRHAAGPDGARGQAPPLEAEPYRERFITAMDDDLNTPRATAVLFDLSHEINRAREERRDVTDAQRTLRELAGVLGLTLVERSRESRGDFFPLFHLLLDTDAELRSDALFEVADRLRERLGGRGVDLEELTGSTGGPLKGPEDMSAGDVAAIIELLIEARADLRAANQYEPADRIRQRLDDLGFILEDTPRGTEWKRVGP
jgi:cysteinyl-tRNA synthetase